MIPAQIPDEPPLTYADSFDVPVLFRNGPANKPKRQWRTAEHEAWSASGGFPAADGWYAPTTTWREIIKAATEVGRDVTPHLQNQPRYAHGELIARISPLYAYLGAHPVTPRHPVPGAKGQRLTLNPVYEHGTERTAQSAVAYRLGMTMTEWACRSLLGLGQTHHLELGGPIPALSGTFKDPMRTLPDLWGRHEAEGMYWLIEAKGGNVGVGALRKGWAQLEAGSKILGSFKHRIVLVGASVRPGDDLFLTIDHDLHSGEPPLPPAGSGANDAAVGPGNLEDHLGESDDALIGAARAQMLAYLALRSAPASQLRTVPVPADRASRRRRSGLTTPLENDDLTLAMRADAAERPSTSSRAPCATRSAPGGSTTSSPAASLEPRSTSACPESCSPPAHASTKKIWPSSGAPRDCAPRISRPSTRASATKPKKYNGSPSGGSSASSKRKPAHGCAPYSATPMSGEQRATGATCCVVRRSRSSTWMATRVSSKRPRRKRTWPSAATTCLPHAPSPARAASLGRSGPATRAPHPGRSGIPAPTLHDSRAISLPEHQETHHHEHRRVPPAS